MFAVRAKKKVVLTICCLVIFTLRYLFALPASNHSYLGSYRDMRITIIGEVLPPQRVRADSIMLFRHKYPIGGTVLFGRDTLRDFEFGDTVQVEGFLNKPMQDDPRIAGFMRNANVRLIERPDGMNIQRGLSNLKDSLIERLNNVFPEPASGFAAGLLVGERADIPREIMDDMRHAGLVHIIALSGFNIIILITFIAAVFSFLPRNRANVLTIFTIAAFTVFVGASASVVRAAIMGSLSLVARIFGRKSSALRALFITAFIMALWDPFIVFHDIGFQLSFGATAGLMLFSAKIRNALRFLPKRFGIRTSLATTLAAQIFTTPLIFYYFRSFSVVAPIANLIVLPVIPLLMLGSFLSLFFGKITAGITWLIFEAVFAAVHFLASLPGAFIDL